MRVTSQCKCVFLFYIVQAYNFVGYNKISAAVLKVIPIWNSINMFMNIMIIEGTEVYENILIIHDDVSMCRKCISQTTELTSNYKIFMNEIR